MAAAGLLGPELALLKFTLLCRLSLQSPSCGDYKMPSRSGRAETEAKGQSKQP